MSSTFYKDLEDDKKRLWTATLIKNGENSQFWERDWNGVRHRWRDCGEMEAQRLYDDWQPPQSTSLDIWDDGA